MQASKTNRNPVDLHVYICLRIKPKNAFSLSREVMGKRYDVTKELSTKLELHVYTVNNLYFINKTKFDIHEIELSRLLNMPKTV